MAKSRTGTWVGLLFAGVGLLLLAIPALWVFMGVTAPTLHPDRTEIPTKRKADPAAQWAGAVERGRELVRASLAEENLPGLSVAVGVGGSLVWAEGFGFANLEDGVAVTPDHRFRIGTASTVLTSAAVGRLMEEGRLQLDEPIQKYVPEYPRPLTVRQLMAHVAGLRNGGGDEAPLLGEHCERTLDAVQHFAGLTLLSEPGTKYRHSSLGWILLSVAVEKAGGQPFLSFVREQVFDPLGMRDTVPDAAESGERVTPYFPRFAARPKYGLHPLRDIDLSCYAGASAFLSTPSDLVRFGMGIHEGKLLRRAAVDLLQTPQRLATGQETGYGLGWELETALLAGRPTRMAGHNGEILGGMVASLLTFPEHGLVVAVTSNISYADTYKLGVKIAEAFADGAAAGKSGDAAGSVH